MQAIRYLFGRVYAVNLLLTLALFSACAMLGTSFASASCPSDPRSQLERAMAGDLHLDAPVAGKPVDVEKIEQSKRELRKILAIDPRVQTRFAAQFDLEGTFKTPTDGGLPAVEYDRFRVAFSGRDGRRISGYVLNPRTSSRPLPCLICLPGHGPGIRGDMGIEPAGSMRTSYGGKFGDFALQAVAHGYYVIAFDPHGLAESSRRFAGINLSQKLGCGAGSISALLAGQSMLSYRVSQVLSAVDFAMSLPDVDDTHIGVVGVSAGGTTALFSAAVDDRIKYAGLVSCASNWNQSILRQLHCLCNYVPAIMFRWNMHDLCAMIAPRPLFVEYGAFDDHFPPDGVTECYKQVKGVYSQMNAESCLGHELLMTGHCGFSGKKLFPFLSAHQ